MPALSYRYLTTGGGVNMEVITTFLVSIAASIVAYFICKWLDGNDDQDNK